MSTTKKIQSALISVFDKNGLEPIVKELHKHNVTIYSTGGTETFIKELNIPVVPVEDVTSYPSILGGRVKTLHPKVFGGILNRQDHEGDIAQMKEYEIPQIDLVIVDLYPFENTVASGAPEADIIEKIDIGGISLIRAAAKNFKDTVIVPSVNEYELFLQMLQNNNGATTLEERRLLATKAFHVSSHYDGAIFNYFNTDETVLKISHANGNELRYGENPHQKGHFFGNFENLFDKLHGKELSYNNLLDVDAAVNLMNEFKNEAPTFAILKHNNACGVAQRSTMKAAYLDALAGDPTSAFGGVLIANGNVDVETAEEINKLFCEVVIAPAYDEAAIEILKEKKNRIILVIKETELPKKQVRTCLNGILVQDKDNITDNKELLTNVTKLSPSDKEIEDLLFASKICKHTKSNTIVLVKDGQLCSSGTGQTSRVDALRQAIEKANSFNIELKGAVMASDAFFPFPDCVEIANNAGITAVIQPGGSIKDDLSINYCNENNIAMVCTGIRHFKH
ncbi:bifunctional phosphoribosylaminoimidazolecarboxamide formyltransferase/IMP cyclohydrolase [Myroides marinus]|jgi:phosphoribosylaminoimidazolecarboxamide formyltransferase/IMP cyclohydrolase|uniref:bifunctional phosphoribosylaminoimidazolecarboxamide formyltransferase/IMP cyclohydrolase n=1 Tax=Myroides marinus TaxID=703342 RepID=UPI0025750A96|nr:bifunctional phosphoribosylaminoimidazolecarboxamide formyltransferase/IMP cyclohydrolase [Myroides marinus]MDR0195128.1 bifunctional phosphoribosylaminoimidazolecarboxamide formyltransferase/IMP cyclohydrolase [Myroides sp.]MDM1347790.1 bifunctional phosphoribosylaminoimidazolecarboxamide formyltransferase/IMP cyclohydrolase [Myroides marinus]MDM1351462.1 bifunctional phosphoribosylaminoimidazolecarboxamide formyltransferase/IMP cyclohydrolase [Myroides marinus]MDM1355153.1 bifunctional pho